jgi:hypothetical protein
MNKPALAHVPAKWIRFADKNMRLLVFDVRTMTHFVNPSCGLKSCPLFVPA